MIKQMLKLKIMEMTNLIPDLKKMMMMQVLDSNNVIIGLSRIFIKDEQKFKKKTK
jgi:hypothetical protein